MRSIAEQPEARQGRRVAVPPAGVEPATARVETGCSLQLSYGGRGGMVPPAGARSGGATSQCEPGEAEHEDSPEGRGAAGVRQAVLGVGRGDVVPSVQAGAADGTGRGGGGG